MNYTELSGKETIEKTQAALTERRFDSLVVNSGAEALAKIKELIPPGASLMNGASRTLEQIGFVDYLREGKHGWNNLHDAILAEKDPAKQALLRRQSVVSDFYLGSAHAVTETGELVFASNSGSQMPALAYTAQNLILVVSTKKIVPTVQDGLRRIDEHILALEDENMMQKYGIHTTHSKTLILHREGPSSKRKVLVLFVQEDLGF